ncbi:MAG TPA: 3'(2'),5'-bisphosphate nucleotidase CysQ [Pseudolabrys sp.]|jgi:3'(2'), 5'-bisphosphate nucleotidase|nr:3'(2'),5'-bisphosphate nucleotidase CysQ [Pseudolabrys sp.]
MPNISLEAVRLMDDLTALVARASALVRAMSPDTVARRSKSDNSPVTAADEASEATILDGLARLLPGVPVVSEESADPATSPCLDGTFVIVDPLDGTREFLAGSDEFAVLLGIVSEHAPVAGIVAAPKRGVVWRGVVGHGAERLRLLDDSADRPQPIRTRSQPSSAQVALVSRSHLDAATDDFLADLGPVTRHSCGSAIKFGLIADGSADVYPRLSPTCEWDVAAGHAVVTAAGGAVLTRQGTPIRFGNTAKNFRIPDFIAWGNAAGRGSTAQP